MKLPVECGHLLVIGLINIQAVAGEKIVFSLNA